MAQNASAELELLLLEKEKRRRSQPSIGSELMAGTKPILETFGAPDQMAGEAVRTAREGLPYRLPEIAQRIPGVQDINNRFVTAQQPPSSFVGEMASGVQGVVQGAIAPLRGMDPLQTAADEIRRPKNTVPDALMQTGLAVAGGNVTNAPFNAAAKMGAAVAKPVGKTAALLSSIGTSVKPRDYGVLFDNPTAMMPGRLKAAGEAFETEAAKLGAGLKGVPSSERIKAMRNSEKYVFDLFEDIKAGKPVPPGRALLGRQAVDKIYPIANDKNGNYRSLLDNIRDAFQNVVGSAPEMSKVSKEYAISKSGSKFLSPVPLTQSGKPGFVRGAAMLEMIRRGNYRTAALGSPLVAGLVTASAGAVAKGIKAVAQNDPLKAALLGAYIADRRKRGQ